MRKTRFTLTGLLAIVALLTAGCGGDDPTVGEVASEARENTGNALDETRETADAAAERAEEIGAAGSDLADDIGDGPDTGEAALEIESPEDGAELSAGSVELSVRVSGFTIIAADGDTSGTKAHYHLFVDREPTKEGEVIPQGEGIIHSAANPIRIPGLSSGSHKLTLVLGDGNHTRIRSDLQDEVTITVI